MVFTCSHLPIVQVLWSLHTSCLWSLSPKSTPEQSHKDTNLACQFPFHQNVMANGEYCNKFISNLSINPMITSHCFEVDSLFFFQERILFNCEETNTFTCEEAIPRKLVRIYNSFLVLHSINVLLGRQKYGVVQVQNSMKNPWILDWSKQKAFVQLTNRPRSPQNCFWKLPAHLSTITVLFLT